MKRLMVIQNVNELMEYSLLKKCIIFVIYFGVEYFFDNSCWHGNLDPKY